MIPETTNNSDSLIESLCCTTVLFLVLRNHVSVSRKVLNSAATFTLNNNNNNNKESRNKKLSSPVILLLPFLVPTLLALALNLNTLKGDFVHDDVSAIVHNRDVTGKRSLINLLWDDFWGVPMVNEMSHKSYRPLTTLLFRYNKFYHPSYDIFANYVRYSIRLNFNVCSGGSWCFHVTNSVLHGLTTTLFTLMCRRGLNMDKKMTLVTSTMFAVHPIHTEAVAGCVGCADLLACVFTIISFLSFLRSFNIPTSGSPSAFPSAINNQMWQNMSTLSAIFAFASKENGLMVFAINLGFMCFHMWDMKEWKKHANKLAFQQIYVPAILVFLRLVLLTQNSNIFPSFANQDNLAASHQDQTTRFLTKMFLPVQSFWLFLCPSNLSYDWQMGSVPLISSFTDQRLVPLLLFYLSLIVLGIKTFREQSRDTQGLRCGLLFLVLPFVPASNLFFTVGFVVAERILYIPSLGYAILVGLGLRRLQKVFKRKLGSRKSQWMTSMMVIFLFGSLATKTFIRNGEWSTRESLFRSGVKAHPQNAKLHYNYGNWLREQGKVEMAKAHYQQAIRIWPRYTVAHNNLAAVAGNELEAKMHLKNALLIDPGHPNSLYNMAILLKRQGHCKKAIPLLERCLKEDKSNEKAEILLLECLFNFSAEEKGHWSPERRRKEAPQNNSNTTKKKAGKSEAAKRIGTTFNDYGTELEQPGNKFNELQEHVTSNPVMEIRSLHFHSDEIGGESSRSNTIFLLVDSYINLGHLQKAEDLLDDFIGFWNTELQQLLETSELQRQPSVLMNKRHRKAIRIKLSQALYQISQVYLEQGRLPEASEAIREAKKRLRCNCKGHKARSTLALSATEKMFLSGLEACRTMISQQADILQHSGRYRRAVRMYQLALNYKRDDPKLLLSIGTMFHLLGKHDQAWKFYLKSHKIYPWDTVLRTNMKILQNSYNSSSSNELFIN